MHYARRVQALPANSVVDAGGGQHTPRFALIHAWEKKCFIFWKRLLDFFLVEGAAIAVISFCSAACDATTIVSSE